MRRGVCLACLSGLLLASCTGGAAESVPEELVVAVAPLGPLDPMVAGAADPNSSGALVARQVFEGLTRYDPATLEVEPALAASWTVSPDATTFTFLLRSDVRFHDGTPVTADDVVASFNRLARGACASTASPRAGAPAYLLSLVVGYSRVAGSCRTDELTGVRAVGDDTVMVSLSRPWADLPAVLAHPAASVVPQPFIRDDVLVAPVGTGPYFVAEPWDGSRLVLVSFDGHREDPPPIRTVRLVGYADQDLAYLDLLAGNVHVAEVPVGRARQARRRFGEGGSVLQVGLVFFGFNLRSDRVADRGFREGLALAVDRQAIATAVYEQTREPAQGLASPAFPGVDEPRCGAACTFDARAARAKIAEAHPDGPPDLVVGVADEGSNPAVGEAVVRMLADVGVEARLRERPFVDHLDGIRAGDMDLFGFGWIPAYPSLDGLLRPLFHSASPDNSERIGYANRDVDELLDRARETLDPGERTALLRDAEERVLADVPVLPLLWYRSSVAFDPRIVPGPDGVLVDGLGSLTFADLGFGGGS